MINRMLVRSKRWLAGAALCAALLVPMLTPGSAKAWWGPGWGWRAGWGGWGWGWRGGVVVGLPPVVVGAPVYPPYPYYPVAYPAYPYGYPYHWVPAHTDAHGTWIQGHWEK
jgi:hypothetical protein